LIELGAFWEEIQHQQSSRCEENCNHRFRGRNILLGPRHHLPRNYAQHATGVCQEASLIDRSWLPLNIRFVNVQKIPDYFIPKTRKCYSLPKWYNLLDIQFLMIPKFLFVVNIHRDVRGLTTFYHLYFSASATYTFWSSVVISATLRFLRVK
jgi:hypothetical protein